MFCTFSMSRHSHTSLRHSLQSRRMTTLKINVVVTIMRTLISILSCWLVQHFSSRRVLYESLTRQTGMTDKVLLMKVLVYIDIELA